MYFCSSFVLEYEKNLIWYQALDIFLEILHAAGNLFYMFSIKKPFQSWFHPSSRSSFDLLANFLLVFCAFGCLTFLPFVREAFLIP